jgi:hypothetical protein
MTHVATVVPAETDLLCESCGYTLNGLPDDANCPECGRPLRDSAMSKRQVPAWERDGGRGVWNFLATTADVTFRPTHFYQTLATRREIAPARQFANIHWIITSLLFGAAAYGHLAWYVGIGGSWAGISRVHWTFAAILVLITFVTLRIVTYIAARLTNWEASYRGLRLPLNVVLRGMYYHAAHYLPVALGAAITVCGYQFLYRRGLVPIDSITTYLYVLCAEVIVFAAFLFHTYWIGMRNMMYANH